MSTRIILRISDDQAAAIAEFVQAKNKAMPKKQRGKPKEKFVISELYREAIMNAIGRSDLAKQEMPRGPVPKEQS